MDQDSGLAADLVWGWVRVRVEAADHSSMHSKDSVAHVHRHTIYRIPLFCPFYLACLDRDDTKRNPPEGMGTVV